MTKVILHSKMANNKCPGYIKNLLADVKIDKCPCYTRTLLAGVKLINVQATTELC